MRRMDERMQKYFFVHFKKTFLRRCDLLKKNGFKFFILVALSHGNCLASQDRFEITENDTNDFSCEGAVHQQFAVFTFIGEAGKKNEIKSNSNYIKTGQLEKAWIVHLKNRIGTFDLGNYVFKTISATIEAEKDEILKRHSEIVHTSIFIYVKDGSMELVDLVPGEKIYSEIVGHDLQIIINGQNILTELFADEPSYIYFWVLDDDIAPRKCRTKVKYQLE